MNIIDARKKSAMEIAALLAVHTSVMPGALLKFCHAVSVSQRSHSASTLCTHIHFFFLK